MSPLDASSLNWFEKLADAGTWLVILGVVGEGFEIVLKILEHKSKNKKFSAWCDRNEFRIEIWGGIFWVMVVVGLMMELRGNHKTKLITDRENTRLNAEAATTRKEASEANLQAGLANDRASSNELQVLVLKKQVADANERIALQRRATMELIFNAYPRDISGRYMMLFNSRLLKFAGTNVVVASVDDPESLAFAKQLKDRLEGAKWNVLPFTNSSAFRDDYEKIVFGGVTVVFNKWDGSAPAPDDTAARELAAGLYEGHVLTRYIAMPHICRDGPDRVLVVFVGRKPTPRDALRIQVDQNMTQEERHKFWDSVITGFE